MMTGKGNYHIDWEDFTKTSSERFRDLVGKRDFSDVTLVSDDGTRMPSHQIILSSGCAFFKKLLVEEASKSPLIFLRGVEAILLEPLLNFLYTGSAEVSEELITQFVTLAEDLGVQGLEKTNPEGLETSIKENEAEDDKAKVAKKIAESLKDIKKEPKTTNFSKECERCQRVFNNRSNLIKHVRLHDRSARERSLATVIKLPDRDNDGMLQCFDCDKKVKCNSNFRRHVQIHHLKIDFKCDECDFHHREEAVVSRHRRKHIRDELRRIDLPD